MTTKPLFKPTRYELSREQTHNAASEIIAAQTEARRKQVAHLKAARLKKEATDKAEAEAAPAPEPKTKAKQATATRTAAKKKGARK